MSKSIIDAAVDRFLSWRLPDDFAPDCGIVFHRDKVDPRPGWWPVGTNLLTANQARAMFEHCLAQTAAPAEAVGECDGCGEVKPLMYCKVCFNQPLAMPADVEQLVTNQGVSSPDPDDLVAWLLSQTHVDIVEKRKQAAARIQADRDRIAELENTNEFIKAKRLGLMNRIGEWVDRVERAEAEVARLTQERDRWREDSLRQTATIQRLGDAAMDRNQVDAIRHREYEAEVARLTQERDTAYDLWYGWANKCTKFETENAKLRRAVEAGKVLRGLVVIRDPRWADFDAAVADLEKP